MICCYLLQSGRRTYVGATVNFPRRIRQHNGEIKGGAKYTRGRKWNCVLRVEGFLTFQQALQFEWRFKHLTKKQRGTSLCRRIKALNQLIHLQKWTSNSPLAKTIKLRIKLLQFPLPLQAPPPHVQILFVLPKYVACIGSNNSGSIGSYLTSHPLPARLYVCENGRKH